MRLLADEHVPTAFVSALDGEGHDVAVVGGEIGVGYDELTNIFLDIFRDALYLVLFIIEIIIISAWNRIHV